MSEDRDFDLVRRCQSDDPDLFEPAFEELYDLFRDRVYNTAYRVVGNAADASDVSQEVFVTVFRKVGEFQFNSRFFTWLYRITVNVAIDRKRRMRARARVLGESAGGSDLMAAVVDDAAPAPDAFAEAEFIEERVQRCIDRLSPKLQAIVVARYIDGLSYEELAEVMECSIGTVKSRLNRAHKSLEGLLRPLFGAMAREAGD